MQLPKIDVLFEDNHLLVLNKPAGAITMGAPAGKPSLLDAAKAYIGQKYNKPGKVYLGAMSRLDVPVSGVILFARTSKAAARLTKQFRTHRVEKIYWAIVSGPPPPPAGECVDWLRKDERHRRVFVVEPLAPGAKEAKLSFRRLARLKADTLLEIRLHTGRKHQIRVQMAGRGNPILGDRKYGSGRAFPLGIALHSRRLVVQHPISREPMEFIAPLNAAWPRLDDELTRGNT